MKHGRILKPLFFLGLFFLHIGLTHSPANAACGAIINGRPMTGYECWLATRAYGYVQPGYYIADDKGNWARVGDRQWRGNIWRDAQMPRSSGGWGAGGSSSGRHTSTTIDPTGGCEGGSCVNILD